MLLERTLWGCELMPGGHLDPENVGHAPVGVHRPVGVVGIAHGGSVFLVSGEAAGCGAFPLPPCTRARRRSHPCGEQGFPSCSWLPAGFGFNLASCAAGEGQGLGAHLHLVFATGIGTFSPLGGL